MKRINWLLWLGLLLSIIAFLSYPFFFVNFPVTRDFPWVNLALFAIAVLLLVLGVKRAFRPDKTRKAKAGAVIGATLGLFVTGLFLFSVFIFARQLPASASAPKVGTKAPEFTLADMSGKQTSLSELLAAPINGKAPKGVLLIFYRGYW